MSKAARTHFDANATCTPSYAAPFLTLNDAAVFNFVLEEGYTSVRRHIIQINGYTDTDNDGLPDTCDADCLATGLTADPDDDNDGVLDESGCLFLSFPSDESVPILTVMVTRLTVMPRACAEHDG